MNCGRPALRHTPSAYRNSCRTAPPKASLAKHAIAADAWVKELSSHGGSTIHHEKIKNRFKIATAFKCLSKIKMAGPTPTKKKYTRHSNSIFVLTQSIQQYNYLLAIFRGLLLNSIETHFATKYSLESP